MLPNFFVVNFFFLSKRKPWCSGRLFFLLHKGVYLLTVYKFSHKTDIHTTQQLKKKESGRRCHNLILTEDMKVADFAVSLHRARAAASVARGARLRPSGIAA